METAERAWGRPASLGHLGAGDVKGTAPKTQSLGVPRGLAAGAPPLPSPTPGQELSDWGVTSGLGDVNRGRRKVLPFFL